jgi:Ca2+:H+ antiporter
MLRLAVLVLVPCSLILSYLLRVGPIPVFATAILAIAALAEYVRRATEDLAELAGPGLGGLIAVTLGNVAEVILAVFVLMQGANDVVRPDYWRDSRKRLAGAGTGHRGGELGP